MTHECGLLWPRRTGLSLEAWLRRHGVSEARIEEIVARRFYRGDYRRAPVQPREGVRPDPRTEDLDAAIWIGIPTQVISDQMDEETDTCE